MKLKDLIPITILWLIIIALSLTLTILINQIWLILLIVPPIHLSIIKISNKKRKE